MDSQSKNAQVSKDLLLTLLLLQCAFCLIVFLDIPIARQVIGFVYLTFVPGFIFLHLIKLENLGNIQTFLFAVGFSIAFLMISGLAVNEIGLMIGVSNPLSPPPLMVTLNGIILATSILGMRKAKPFLSLVSIPSRLIQFYKTIPILLLLVSIPILSVVGAIWVNAFDNNIILLFLMVAISSVFAIGVASRKLLPPKFYSLAVFVIAISLLFHSLFISNYLVSFGSDIYAEYYVFKNTQITGYWDITNPFLGKLMGRYHSMLSITILPTVYSNLLNIDSAWVFKLLFPLIFSLVPLALYQLWKGLVGKRGAFISSFLFMSYSVFYTEMMGLNRQSIAEVFFVLLLLVVLSDNIKRFPKILCFAALSFGLITSHYGLAEIFAFFIVVTFFSLFVLRPRTLRSRKITASMVVLFLVLMFSWYIYTSKSTVFDSIVDYSTYVRNQLSDFLNPASRGEMVLRGLGMETPPSIWNSISRAFAYATQFLIVVGFIGLIIKRRKAKVDDDHLMLIVVGMVLLALLILVPGLASTLKMSRFYHILLFFLAPLCVIGAEVISNLISKKKKEVYASALLLIVLIPYFLFQTYFIYEVAGGDSWSLPLSEHRMDMFRLVSLGHIDEEDIFSARWLSKNVDIQRSQIYADALSQGILVGYGLVSPTSIMALANVTMNGIIYLDELNVIEGKIASTDYTWNITEFSFLENLNIVYSNGRSEIYKSMNTSP